jgi:hypothetical protein
MKLTNGKIVVEVPDHKADKFCAILDMYKFDDTSEETVKPTPRRGRPPKKVN